MSEQWPGIGSEQRNVESEAIDSSSANGASSDEPAGESLKPAVADSGGVADNGTATDDRASNDEGSVFLAELVRAMQTTAGVERVRIDEDTERRRQAHIEQVRAREAAEADHIRELADEDMKAIEAWASGETKRIQAERKRRATERGEKLERSLAEHGSKIEQEVDRVEEAIATYRADVEAFFAGLESESDLVVIAQRAARRPTFPALDAAAQGDAIEADLSFAQAPPPVFDEAATDAQTAGADEPAVVGVMDHQALAEAFEAWSAPPATIPGPEPSEGAEGAEQGEEAREPADQVTASGSPSHGSPGSLFQSLPVPRPMSFLRRDPNGGDHSKDER